ncbi:MAG: alpha/beta hydrolase fold protein [Myxococcaceae bacterium]|nr:alpha/beta hydrolase fold protein [Myxococcaceae bacterium]
MTRRALALAALALAACGHRTFVPLRPVAAVASAGVAHATGSFAGRGGLTLFEQSWRPAAGARAALVIVHGLRSHSGRYDAFARREAARGVAVYAFDLRGHGRSAGERSTLPDFDELTGDLAVFLERVRGREPGRPVFLMGHSAGGAVVTLFAMQRRPALAGLILLAPALRIDRSAFEVAATPVTAALLPDAPLVDTRNADFSRDPDVVRVMGLDPLIDQAAGPGRTAAGLLDAIERIWRRPGALDVPLLGLHGTADRVTDPRGTAELVRRAGSDDRTLLLYRGLVHDLLQEPERGQVADDVDRWIDARLPAGR